ncbi:MAG: GatB/YqeY domain-containing protein [Bacilli bacterium]|nr:GatB/YqeY domain-containing protein [Bacilli bacterium]
MREKILEDLKKAMKEQNKKELSVIRMLKGAMQMEELNKKAELTDDEVISLIAKQIKTRKESILEFEKGNREDLIKETKDEIEILNKYMPEQLSEEEIEKIINEAFIKINPSSIKDMGKIMSEVNPKLKGRADMGYVSSIIKNKLSNS